ncbi:hypothetical protein MNBD_GAMMA26-2562, partial [hydrothermal vent metagenome]
MFAKTINYPTTKPLIMKFSRSDIYSKTHALPALRFEDQQLTSFSGLVVFQKLFECLALKERLRKCFRHQRITPIYGHASIVLLLVIHLLLGYRELRHLRYYENDPLVLRLLGLNRLPDVATISRQLARMDNQSVENLQQLQHALVLDRLKLLSLKRITIDFDGSV